MRFKQAFTITRKVRPSGKITWICRYRDPSSGDIEEFCTGKTSRGAARKFCEDLFGAGPLVPELPPFVAGRSKSVPDSSPTGADSHRIVPIQSPTSSVLRTPVPGETIKDYFGNWFRPGCPYCAARADSERPRSRRHIENQRRNLDLHLFPALGSIPVLELSRNQVIAWRAKLKMGPRGRNAAAQTVGYLYGELLRNGMVALNPAAKIYKLPEPHKTVDLLSQLEFESLFNVETLAGYWHDKPLHFAACLVIAQTGLRISEVQALRGQSLIREADSDWLVVEAAWDRLELRNRTKSGKGRRVPITTELATNRFEQGL